MQVHGPDQVVKSVDVGEYHLGTVRIYLGPVTVDTYSEEDCDAIIIAASAAKDMHAAAMYRPVLPHIDEAVLNHMRARLGEPEPPCKCGHAGAEHDQPSPDADGLRGGRMCGRDDCGCLKYRPAQDASLVIAGDSGTAITAGGES